jgi:acetate kinase
MRILVVNAGSSSLKLSVLDDDDSVVASESLPTPQGTVDEAALHDAIGQHHPIDAVGHRIVHGGTEFVAPVRLDTDIVRRLWALADLAPLHQPRSMRAVDIVGRVLPGVPAVGCFDTAFHASLPPAASTYALPSEWRARWDLRRYGFHGLSHAWATRRAAQLLRRPAEDFRLVSCHLGAGASLCAVDGGQSVDTTMGFTPLEGLVMATRSGSVDPGLVLWLEEHVGMPPSELASTLEHRSGLLGLTGTADMRAIVDSATRGDARAAAALNVYVHRLRGGIAAMAAAMNGLDVLLFTGGVGEASAAIRTRAATGLGFLGVDLDEQRNGMATGDADIGAGGGPARCLVVTAREDLEISRQVRSVLGPSPLA